MRVWFNCYASLDLGLSLIRWLARLPFSRVKNLVIQLNFVLQPLSTAVEELDTLFFISINGNFRLFWLEGPALLSVVHWLSHFLFLGMRFLFAFERHARGSNVHCIKVALSVQHSDFRTRMWNASRAWALTFNRYRFHKYQFIMLVLTGAWNGTHFRLETLFASTERYSSEVPWCFLSFVT